MISSEEGAGGRGPSHVGSSVRMIKLNFRCVNINFLHLHLLYEAVLVSKQDPHNSFILLPLRGRACAPFP